MRAILVGMRCFNTRSITIHMLHSFRYDSYGALVNWSVISLWCLRAAAHTINTAELTSLHFLVIPFFFSFFFVSSPGIPRPSLHLQLISSLVSLYLYLSTFTCSLPDCLVCFAKLSRVCVLAIAWLPCFDPVCLYTGFRIPYLPLFGFVCLIDWSPGSDRACLSIGFWLLCLLLVGLFVHWMDFLVLTLFEIRSKITSATHCVCCRAFGFLSVCTWKCYNNSF